MAGLARCGDRTVILAVILSILAPFVSPAADEEGPPLFSARVDSLFSRWDTSISPGCSVAVMKDSVMLHKRGYGMANLDYAIPNRPDTVFHIASTSKQFTAAAIALLILDGRLSLGDEVRKYVPELPDFGVPVTIRHLVYHSSGLREQHNLLQMSGWRKDEDLITTDDVMEVVSRQKTLNFRPNSRYSYSNTGYTLLAMIVERVTGQTLRQFAEERIFRPLGMKNTFFRDDYAQIARNLAAGYKPEGDVFKTSLTNQSAVGGSGVLTTVEDLLIWAENFFRPRVGGPAFIAQMLQRSVLEGAEQMDYAFGIWLGDYRGLASLGHAGSDAGYTSDMLVFPEQRFSVVCLCNRSDADTFGLVRQIADIYLEKKLAPLESRRGLPPGMSLSPEQLSRYAGTYLHREMGAVVRFTVQEGGLREQWFQWGAWSEPQPLVALGVNRFREAAGDDEIVFSSKGAARHASIAWKGSKTGAKGSRTGDEGKSFVYEAIPPGDPASSKLGAYTGTYGSDEIGVPYRIGLLNGALVLSLPKWRNLPLIPVGQDVFSSKLGIVIFERVGESVAGFSISHSQAAGLHFTKP